MIRLTLTPAQQREAKGGEITISEEQARFVRAKLTAAAGAGRPRTADRCKCGAMTTARAAKRGHRCEAEVQR